MKQYLKEALTLADGDFADIRYEKVQATTIQYQKKDLKAFDTSTLEGGQTRALKNGGLAYRAFTDLAKAGAAVRGACRSAEVMGKHSRAPEGLSRAPVVKDDVKANPAIDPRSISLEEKRKLIEDYTELALSIPGVVTTTFAYSERFAEETLLNTEGTEITQELLFCRIGGRIVAKEGERNGWDRIDL